MVLSIVLVRATSASVEHIGDNASVWLLVACLETGSAVLEMVAFLFDDNGTPFLNIVVTFLKWQLGLAGLAVSFHIFLTRGKTRASTK